MRRSPVGVLRSTGRPQCNSAGNSGIVPGSARLGPPLYRFSTRLPSAACRSTPYAQSDATGPARAAHRYSRHHATHALAPSVPGSGNPSSIPGEIAAVAGNRHSA